MKITVRERCSEAYHAEKDGKEFQVGLRFEDGTATYPKKCTVIIDGEEETVDIGEGDDRIKKAVKAGAEKLGYKIVESTSKKSESMEGWDDWEEIEGLEDALYNIEDLAYELRSCVRGANTNCKTWAELSKYVVRLADTLRSAGEDLKYKQDESKKPESDANEDKRNLEALRARFCDNPERAKIGRLSSPYDDIAVYGTQTWSDGVPVMKYWYRDNKKIPVTLKKGTRCIVMPDSEYGEEAESVWIPYHSGWLRVDGSDIEVDY